MNLNPGADQAEIDGLLHQEQLLAGLYHTGFNTDRLKQVEHVFFRCSTLSQTNNDPFI